MYDKCSDCEYGDIENLRVENRFLKEENEKLKMQNQKDKEVINKAISLLEDDNICADIRRFKPKENENKYGVEQELLDILKEVD